MITVAHNGEGLWYMACKELEKDAAANAMGLPDNRVSICEDMHHVKRAKRLRTCRTTASADMLPLIIISNLSTGICELVVPNDPLRQEDDHLALIEDLQRQAMSH